MNLFPAQSGLRGFAHTVTFKRVGFPTESVGRCRLSSAGSGHVTCSIVVVDVRCFVGASFSVCGCRPFWTGLCLIALYTFCSSGSTFNSTCTAAFIILFAFLWSLDLRRNFISDVQHLCSSSFVNVRVSFPE